MRHPGTVSLVVLEVDPALWFLLPPRRRRPRFAVDVPASDTVGHVVRMVGIPPTEVGEVRLDARPVGLDARPAGTAPARTSHQGPSDPRTSRSASSAQPHESVTPEPPWP